MTSFALKIIALICMFCDHFGNAYLGHFSFLNLIGRCAFPIFAFQISEGYIHTSNIKKYFLRISLFALISQIPFSLFMVNVMHSSPFSLNVFFTLLLGLIAIYLYDYVTKIFNTNTSMNSISKKTKSSFIKIISIILGLLIVGLLAYIAEILHTDYGYWGVIIVFMFYIFKNKKIISTLAFFALCILKYIEPIMQTNFNIIYILVTLFTFLPIIFIDAYNGKQGPKIKYLLYIFYPVHLLILALIFN